MTPAQLASMFLDDAGTPEGALLKACETILKMLPATSMGMLRCGKKPVPIDSEYGGK